MTVQWPLNQSLNLTPCPHAAVTVPYVRFAHSGAGYLESLGAELVVVAKLSDKYRVILAIVDDSMLVGDAS